MAFRLHRALVQSPLSLARTMSASPYRNIFLAFLILCTVIIVALCFALSALHAALPSVIIEAIIASLSLLAICAIFCEKLYFANDDKRPPWIALALMAGMTVAHLAGALVVNMSHNKLGCSYELGKTTPACRAFKGLVASSWSQVLLSLVLTVMAAFRVVTLRKEQRAAPSQRVRQDLEAQFPHRLPEHDNEKPKSQKGMLQRILPWTSTEEIAPAPERPLTWVTYREVSAPMPLVARPPPTATQNESAPPRAPEPTSRGHYHLRRDHAGPQVAGPSSRPDQQQVQPGPVPRAREHDRRQDQRQAGYVPIDNRPLPPMPMPPMPPMPPPASQWTSRRGFSQITGPTVPLSGRPKRAGGRVDLKVHRPQSLASVRIARKQYI